MAAIESLNVLPIAMIPAACLLLLTFNNRLMPLLKNMRELHLLEKPHSLPLRKYFFMRIRLLQASILSAYTALSFFTLAAFFIILSTIASHLVYIIVILLITGCFMTFFSVISAIIEVSYATTLFAEREKKSSKGVTSE